jgi:4-hydroxy-3-polyprenylbenzoate decarboxylase
MTGASGVVYGVRLVEVLVRSNREIHLIVSPSGWSVIRQELQDDAWDNFNFPALLPPELKPAAEGLIRLHRHDDFFAPLASGSFLTGGMVVCPCSGSTMSGIAHGASNNLIQRAADVHLKERRKLILVPRETPLSVIQLDNMRRAAEAGAVVLPAMPGWYHGVKSVQDLVDFVVARILDQLGVPHELMRRWGK